MGDSTIPPFTQRLILDLSFQNKEQAITPDEFIVQLKESIQTGNLTLASFNKMLEKLTSPLNSSQITAAIRTTMGSNLPDKQAIGNKLALMGIRIAANK